MLSTKETLSLTKLPAPLLTAYINGEQLNRPGARPAGVSWLRKEANEICKTLPTSDQEQFRSQIDRMKAALTEAQSKAKGMVIFAGPATWKMVPLELGVKNELHWGEPAVSQLLDLFHGEKANLVVAIDRAGARFFRHEPGGMAEYEESKFDIDETQWKKRDFSHMARRATEMPHGNQRDLFKKRVDAQYQHLCREVAKRAAALTRNEAYGFLVLIGSDRLTKKIKEALPREVRKNVMLIAEDLARVPKRVLQTHADRGIAERNGQDAMHSVEELLGANGKVLGLDETLAQLQKGYVSRILMNRGLDRDIKRCVKCGLASDAADPACAVCGGERRNAKLSDILPELLRLHRADIEVVDGKAAERLREAGGVGGWLRRTKSAE
jgi:hypothetical protein